MNKKVWAWGIYDLANTAFSALFVTFFFPLLIIEAGGTEFQVGLVMGLSMLLVGLIVPVLGAVSDLTGRRMPYIMLFTVLCVVATAATGFVSLSFALVLGFIANFCYHGALTFYNALMPHLGEQHGWLSGFGVALGYVGTLLSLLMAYFLFGSLGWDNQVALQWIFAATALFFLVFSLPLFFIVKDKKVKRVSNVLPKAVAKITLLIKDVKKHGKFLWFLLASFLYTNGMNTAIIFLYLFSRESIGLGIQEFMGVFAVFSIASCVGAYVFGKLTDRCGPKTMLLWSLALWVLVVILLTMTQSYWYFVLMGCLGGIALGAVWTVNRPFLLELVPSHSVGESFGFLELSGKFSGVIGPILFGYLVGTSGYTVALLSLLVFFIPSIVIVRYL